MHPSIEQLLKVQKADREIRFLEEARRLRPQELEDERRKHASATASLADVIERIKEKRLAADRGELDVRQRDAQIEKTTISLNSAKTNQEYAVLREQIARLEDERGKLEEQVLGILTEIDQLEELKIERQRELAAQEKAYARKEGEVAETVQGLEGQIEAETRRRAELARSVDPDHLELYERILRHHRDSAISAVKDGICQGCFMRVTAQDRSVLMLGKEILQCRSCSRLLFLD